MTKLPENFKFLLWSYDFSEIDPDKDKERIVINTVNYGDWSHWRWIINYYGKEELRGIIRDVPASEFREGALKLISLLLGIKKLKYESQGAKIKAEKDTA